MRSDALISSEPMWFEKTVCAAVRRDIRTAAKP